MGLSVHSSLLTKTLLFVGFEHSLSPPFTAAENIGSDFTCESILQPVYAFQWLTERAQADNDFELPYAILFNFDSLEEDEFRLVQLVRSNARLCHIPIIALATEEALISPRILVQRGLDDCYTLPVQWDALTARLAFLHQYKSQLAVFAQKKPAAPQLMRISPVKRMMDIAGASFGIVLLSPLLVFTALAIRIESKGPVIYRSKRIGAGYQSFEFLKFRSMYADADARLLEMQHLNQYGATTTFMKFTNDPRVTRVGGIIRKLSIDELPQLLNVLRGDMSLVGNRPLPLYEAEQMTRDAWSTRFLAPAGITGLWQVTKRGHADMSAEERVALDVQYANNNSFWTDMGIILRTFTAFVQKEAV